MDTSKQYIKMCEKARKIQKDWQISVSNCMERDDGDFYYPTVGDGYEMSVSVSNYEFPWPHPDAKNLIWLPRQDQLQGMMQPCGFNTLLIYFPDFAKLEARKEYITSMEQLWLAFVMKEKYNKVWSGEDWAIKKKEGNNGRIKGLWGQ